MTEPKFIFINGNINSGKTTLGKNLYTSLRNSEFTDVDYIIGDYLNFKDRMSFPEFTDLRFNTMLQKIKTLRANKIYIFSYLFFQYRYQKILDILPQQQFIFITLIPSMRFLLKNKKNRKLTEEEKEKIVRFHNIGITSYPHVGLDIDNTFLSETATKLVALKYISKNILTLNSK